MVAKKDPNKYTEEDFQELYTQETGKKAIWGGKVTKAYIEWLEKKREEQDLAVSKTTDSGEKNDDEEKHFLSDEEVEIMEDYKKELVEMREKLEKDEIYHKSADNYGGYTFESSIEDHVVVEMLISLESKS